jgi:hypothetical protein
VRFLVLILVEDCSKYNKQGRIYAQAKGARAQGGILKKIEIEVWYAEKKAFHEREI